MLEIRTQPYEAKKYGIRVELFRKYHHKNPTTQKIVVTPKYIGSFLLAEGYNNDLIALLQPEEVIELENWMAEAKFASRFSIKANQLKKKDKITLRIPEKIYNLLPRLAVEARRVGIHFIPSEIMLDALLNKAIQVEQQIDKINGVPCGILEGLNIKEQYEQQKAESQKSDNEARILFKTLLKLGEPLGKICSELETVVRQHGKDKKIPPPQLRDWAGDMPHRNPNKPIKKWAFSIAIDVLLKYKVDPTTLLPLEKIVDYWLCIRMDLTLKAAKAAFIEQFQIKEPALKQTAENTIENLFKS